MVQITIPYAYDCIWYVPLYVQYETKHMVHKLHWKQRSGNALYVSYTKIHSTTHQQHTG